MMTDRYAAHRVHEHAQPQLSRCSRSRRMAGLGVVVLAIAVAACNGALPSPSRDASQGQTMMDLADALNQIRDQSASLQDQVDSLRDVIFRQDTIIRQLALTAGIPMPVSR